MMFETWRVKLQFNSIADSHTSWTPRGIPSDLGIRVRFGVGKFRRDFALDDCIKSWASFFSQFLYIRDSLAVLFISRMLSQQHPKVQLSFNFHSKVYRNNHIFNNLSYSILVILFSIKIKSILILKRNFKNREFFYTRSRKIWMIWQFFLENDAESCIFF